MAQPSVCMLQPREGTPLTHRCQLRLGETPSPSGMQNSISSIATGPPTRGETTALGDPPPRTGHFPWEGDGVPAPPSSAPERARAAFLKPGFH